MPELAPTMNEHPPNDAPADSCRPRTLTRMVWLRLWLLWRFVRQVSGDDTYERYLAHMRETHPGQPVMPPAEFHRTQLEQKWSRVSRCC